MSWPGSAQTQQGVVSTKFGQMRWHVDSCSIKEEVNGLFRHGRESHVRIGLRGACE